MNTFEISVTLEKDTCGKCGGVYALNESFLREARKSGGGYHCPYCQTGWSWKEGEADRLRRQLAERDTELANARAEVRAEKCRVLEQIAIREKLEKKLHRAGKGVCPCCNRFFSNLARHMKSKHQQIESTKP